MRKIPKIIKCLNCGGFFGSKDIRRKFCCKNCASSYNSKCRKKVSFCLFCGALLSNRHSKFCSIHCFNSYKHNRKVDLWLNGKISGMYGENLAPFVKKYLIDLRGNKCEKCGWAKINPTTHKIPLTTNHIDGNYENTVPTNLELLCPNCHSLTYNYGSLNKGRGRKHRRLKKRVADMAQG